MDTLFYGLGGCFVGLALFFLLGLTKPFAQRFYPENPGVVRRAAAPVLFSLLAIACFRGNGLSAMLFVAVAGAVLITLHHRKVRREKASIRTATPVAAR